MGVTFSGNGSKYEGLSQYGNGFGAGPKKAGPVGCVTGPLYAGPRSAFAVSGKRPTDANDVAMRASVTTLAKTTLCARSSVNFCEPIVSTP